ncbi:DNA polymerase IV (plasmid) [Lactobacillus parabuchneri] [Lactiplantibacillus mudanjiangensis]|nr:DNA polymerase IV (plasmid) [Lactobacillus parabuchneri] [Lactiplantibacillus mudanjiangensis]
MFTDDEPHGVFFLIDNKSFYASCEALARGLNPLKVPLVVLSEAKNTNGGLILATSPEAKQLFHIKANVSRKRDLPNDPRLWVVPPRMNLYIERNLQINQIFYQFTTEKEVWPYSIDESILDRLWCKNNKRSDLTLFDNHLRASLLIIRLMIVTLKNQRPRLQI